MFKNMKIGLRMGLGFAVLLALMVALIVVSLNHMEVTHEMLNHIVKVNNVRISLANNMIDDARETAIAVRSILLAKYKNQTNESIQKLRDEITEHRRSFSDGLSKLKELIAMDDIKGLDLFSKIVVSGDAARQLQDQVIELAAAGKPGDGIDLMTAKAYPTMKQWIKGLDDLIDHNKERTAMRYDEAEKAEAAARTSMFTLGALSIVLAVVIGVFLTLSIVRPLRSMSEIAATISEGDLSIKIGYISTDEMGELAKSFDKMIGYLKEISGVADNIASNNLSIKFKPVSEKDVLGNAFVVMVDNLRAMIKDIQEGVNPLASSSNQILALTTQLAASSNETATAVTETTTTMEEVRQTSRQMSQRAAVVSEAAQSTAQTSEAGRRSVEDAIAGMGRIKEQMDVIANNIVKLSEQSQTIGMIISTVNDLANQSNILAVNASIEAAKAGE